MATVTLVGTRGRGVLVAIAAAAAVVAVIVALPGGDDRASGAPQTPDVVGRGLSADNDPAVTSIPTTPTTVTIPALPASSSAGSGDRTGIGAVSALVTSTTPSATGAATTSPARSHRTTSSSPSRSSPAPTTTARARATTAGSTHSTSQPAPPPATATPTPAAPTTTPRTTSTPPPAPPRTTAALTTTKTTTTKTTTTKTTSKSPPAPHFGIPVTVGNATQIITVTASSSSATTGTLRAWQKRSNGTWFVAHGPYPAWLGAAGIGHQSEGSTRTPLGTFTLTQAFGRDPDPGTALPYHQTNPNDWWVSDVHSKLYNTLQNCVEAACPFNTSVSEHLYYEVPYYDYAVVMDVNRWPAIPGDGSAFFLHISPHHQPTAGCVAIDEGPLLTIMRWLDPAKHPRIATGIG